MKNLLSTQSFLRRFDGPMTEELALSDAAFGLGKLPSRLRPEATVRSVCGFCSTGCSLDMHLREGSAVNLSPSVLYPVNLGMACPKGWEALTPLDAPDRATRPLLRNRSSGRMEPVSWDRALTGMVERFRSVMDLHGPGSVAMLSTGQICTEEMAFAGALWKFGFGALHSDSNTRQCMATSHVAYKQSFGFDAPPYSYQDFEQSDVLVFIGSNLCIAHPILWQRVLKNPQKPEIIVVDPRRTETAMNATQHLALSPKSDLILLYGLAALLIQRGWVDIDFVESHTSGYEEFSEFVLEFSPERVAAETGISAGQLLRVAETIHRGKAVSFWWTMGVNQSHESTRTAQAIINLALMTGNIGRPGTGANSITGQCNAMGSRLFANATGLLGGRDFLNPVQRAEVADVLGIPGERIPQQNSLAYDQIIEGVESGEIKALWIIATNTAHSWGGTGALGRALQKLEFLAVQDLYTTTETAAYADLILPAAGWGEKEGTLINSERRLGVVRKVRRAPGEALSDFNILRLVALYSGNGPLFKEWSSPEAVFEILKRLSAGRPCDITGIRGYGHLDAAGGIQWPFSSADREACSSSPTAGGDKDPLPVSERRLFGDGLFFTPDSRARFIYAAPRAMVHAANSEFPVVLLTGRGTSAQWHTNTRTGKSAVLRSLYPPEVYVEVHPVDLAGLGLASGDRVRIRSRWAVVECRAVATSTVQPGQIFMPMHYGETNLLTRPECDPHSRQPSYKYCAVRLETPSAVPNV